MQASVWEVMESLEEQAPFLLFPLEAVPEVVVAASLRGVVWKLPATELELKLELGPMAEQPVLGVCSPPQAQGPASLGPWQELALLQVWKEKRKPERPALAEDGTGLVPLPVFDAVMTAVVVAWQVAVVLLQPQSPCVYRARHVRHG